MTEHYGEEWRRWPGGCRCHGEGRGYFMRYRELFDAMFATVTQPTKAGGEWTLYLVVRAEGDAGEVYGWSFGYFSWTPDGDLWQTILDGIAPTRARAEGECRLAVDNYGERVVAL